jgi:hypothetical protein
MVGEKMNLIEGSVARAAICAQSSLVVSAVKATETQVLPSPSDTDFVAKYLDSSIEASTEITPPAGIFPSYSRAGQRCV